MKFKGAFERLMQFDQDFKLRHVAEHNNQDRCAEASSQHISLHTKKPFEWNAFSDQRRRLVNRGITHNTFLTRRYSALRALESQRLIDLISMKDLFTRRRTASGFLLNENLSSRRQWRAFEMNVDSKWFRTWRPPIPKSLKSSFNKFWHMPENRFIAFLPPLLSRWSS